MCLPIDRFRVVITTCSLSFAMGPECFQALPISSSRFTTFGARRPSRVGGAFRIKLQCLRFNGSSHSSTTVVTALRRPFASRCFQNLLSSILLKSLYIGIVESARRILTGVEVAEEAVGLQILDMLIDLLERYLFIGDTAPRCILSIRDEDVDLSIAGEQFRQLISDELYLGRSDVEMADIVAQRQD